MTANITYKRLDLLRIGAQMESIVTSGFSGLQETLTLAVANQTLPASILRSARHSWVPRPDMVLKRRCRDLKNPRGCREGLQARLKAASPAIPSLFLANMQSMANKMDE